MATERKRKEIYTWEGKFPLYALSSSQRNTPDASYRFAVGSFIEEYNNRVQIIQLDDDRQEFVSRGYVDHPYPATKCQWAPESLAAQKDMLATTGDYLRLWTVHGDHDIRSEAVLNNTKSSDYCAPITSFDWNSDDPSLLATSSIDTTCTIWDINVKKIRTQLIAHDREVYDIAWSRSRDIFCTVGADGSLRLFDLRALEHSTIMYESSAAGSTVGASGSTSAAVAGGAASGGTPPLLRLAWNKLDVNYLATFAQDSKEVVLLDIRMPSYAVATLSGHSACVNGIAWAPQSACHLCTSGDDYQALIWDLSSLPRPVEDPVLAYTAEAEINNVAWSPSMQDWVTIVYNNKLQILRV